jgi:hypothetical protein
VGAKATGARLHKYDGGRASGSISQMRGPWAFEEPTIFKRRKFAQQELVYDIQSEEHSSVRLFPASSDCFINRNRWWTLKQRV